MPAAQVLQEFLPYRALRLFLQLFQEMLLLAQTQLKYIQQRVLSELQAIYGLFPEVHKYLDRQQVHPSPCSGDQPAGTLLCVVPTTAATQPSELLSAAFHAG